jgi:hypothetical protein
MIYKDRDVQSATNLNTALNVRDRLLPHHPGQHSRGIASCEGPVFNNGQDWRLASCCVITHDIFVHPSMYI